MLGSGLSAPRWGDQLAPLADGGGAVKLRDGFSHEILVHQYLFPVFPEKVCKRYGKSYQEYNIIPAREYQETGVA